MRGARSLVGRARKRAESLMVDRCLVSVVVDTSTDPDTGEVTADYDTVYEGRCKLQNQRLRYPSNPEAGEHSWTVGPTEVHVPVDGTSDIVNDALVEITDSADPANVGRQLRVRIGDRKSLQTAIRLLVEEVVA